MLSNWHVRERNSPGIVFANGGRLIILSRDRNSDFSTRFAGTSHIDGANRNFLAINRSLNIDFGIGGCFVKCFDRRGTKIDSNSTRYTRQHIKRQSANSEAVCTKIAYCWLFVDGKADNPRKDWFQGFIEQTSNNWLH